MNFGNDNATPVFYICRPGGGHGVAEFSPFAVNNNQSLIFKVVVNNDSLIFMVNGNAYVTNIGDHGLQKIELNNILTAFTTNQGFSYSKIQYFGEVKETSNQYAQSFLSNTGDICDNYDGVTDNKDALEAIWPDLEAEYSTLDNYEKMILKTATTTEDTLGSALARYDYVVAKYSLTDFLDRNIVS